MREAHIGQLSQDYVNVDLELARTTFRTRRLSRDVAIAVDTELANHLNESRKERDHYLAQKVIRRLSRR
eukprot:1778915-Pyramimonas_sp.AAC.1